MDVKKVVVASKVLIASQTNISISVKLEHIKAMYHVREEEQKIVEEYGLDPASVDCCMDT